MQTLLVALILAVVLGAVFLIARRGYCGYPQRLSVVDLKHTRRSKRARRDLVSLDKATGAARFFDRMVREIETDLGGRRHLSRIEGELIRAFAGAATTLQYLNVQVALGEGNEIDLAARARTPAARRHADVFQPNEQERLDFEAAVEGTLLDLRKRFWLRKVLFDPSQMQATAQRLTRAGLQLEEFPQSPGNLTTASQNLFELIEGQNLVAYPDAAIRLAMSRAIALETPRGWRISKEKAAHKIDVVVALAMAAYAAVKGQTEDTYVHDYSRWL